MVLAPEHPLVDALTALDWPTDIPQVWTGNAPSPREPVNEYRTAREPAFGDGTADEGKRKTGVFTGGYAINPVNGERIPVFIADYVLMGYGTGAIMAVPGQDQRDWDFATVFELPIIRTVQPPADWTARHTSARAGDQLRIPGGLDIAAAKARIIFRGWRSRARPRRGDVQAARLAVSRQRYWGEAVPHRLRRERPAAGDSGRRSAGAVA